MTSSPDFSAEAARKSQSIHDISHFLLSRLNSAAPASTDTCRTCGSESDVSTAHERGSTRSSPTTPNSVNRGVSEGRQCANCRHKTLESFIASSQRPFSTLASRDKLLKQSSTSEDAPLDLAIGKDTRNDHEKSSDTFKSSVNNNNNNFEDFTMQLLQLHRQLAEQHALADDMRSDGERAIKRRKSDDSQQQDDSVADELPLNPEARQAAAEHSEYRPKNQRLARQHALTSSSQDMTPSPATQLAYAFNHLPSHLLPPALTSPTATTSSPFSAHASLKRKRFVRKPFSLHFSEAACCSIRFIFRRTDRRKVFLKRCLQRPESSTSHQANLTPASMTP